MSRFVLEVQEHAEVLRITYDPAKISYDELLEVFWGSHDPTILNRQGNDIGTQFRSVVIYDDEDQKPEHYFLLKVSF